MQTFTLRISAALWLTAGAGMAATQVAPFPAQGQPEQQQQGDRVPIYKVTVVQRALQAVNFQRHTGPTDINLKGTVLMSKAEGRATVEVQNGYTKIDLNIKKLDPPTLFGTEFLTYVLWAISRETGKR